ncbi:MAG: hypothetical protein JXR96_00530 [Deltaproteobacteria bacterium]|nr:hypothetical protein [Deltaproteobacteria bacterium]
MKRSSMLCSAVAIAAALGSGEALAGAPELIPIQGVLTDASGAPLEGPVELHLALYAAESGGEALWSETQSITVASGLFAVYLGAETRLDLALFRDHEALWLGLRVGAGAEGARIRLGSAPYAGLAAHASYTAGSGISISAGNVIASALGESVESEEIADGTVRPEDLADAGCQPGQVLVWSGTGWACGDRTPAIACDWTGWRKTGNPECGVSGLQCVCWDYDCVEIECDGTRVVQVSSARCTDIDHCSAACPYFYSFDGLDYVRDTTILYELDGRASEQAQLRQLEHLDCSERVRAKIVELEPETSYIDRLRLVVEDSLGTRVRRHELAPIFASRELSRIVESDDSYLVLEQGETVYVEFERAPALDAGWSRRVSAWAEGYYERSAPESGRKR